MDYKIVERSFLARIARFIFKSSTIAMVIGNTIYLSGVEKQVFLSNRKWLIHELMHIEQFKRFGLFPFIFLYLWESIRKGYYNNKFECEARNAEDNWMQTNEVINPPKEI